MHELQQIQNQVAKWSIKNFGSQRSKLDPALTLGSLAPLLGLIEEFGELSEAVDNQNREEIEDALGDIGIYLCDYTSREGILLPIRENIPDYKVPPITFRTLNGLLGKLVHITLKRHQGIRGYDDTVQYRQTQYFLLQRLLDALDETARDLCGKPFLVLLDATWHRVKTRDWNKNPTAG